MSMRSVIVSCLVILLIVPAAHAQDRSDLWHDFAQKLAPGSFVIVNLKDGKRVEGRVVQVAPDTMTVLPKTRIVVPARMLAFADVDSIDARKEGMSPGAKVLIGVASAAGVIFLTAAVALAGMK
jgi:hypothetical protein